MSRRNFGTIKSLLHFDYPYFNEPNDGLGDEIGLETWTKSSTSSVNLHGSEIPKAGVCAPKFGYRCLRTYKGSVQCNNESGIWNLTSNGSYEIEMFVKFLDVTKECNIFSLMDTEKTTAILKLSLTTSGLLNFVSSGLGAESTSGMTALTKNIWYHILVRISGGRARVYLDGHLELATALSPEIELAVGQVRIGNDLSNYTVYVDEFVFRHSAGKGLPRVPTEPYNAYLDEENIGGYGTGSDGDKVIAESMTMNTCGTISAVNDSTALTVSDITEGDCVFANGTEVLIHVTAPLSTTVAEYPSTGLYEFRKITSISDTEDGKSITLDKSIDTENGDTFTLDSTLLETYKVQVISVPNYNTLTINAEATVSPTEGSGIVVFRCKGDCTINGKILTSGYGLIRYDMIQMTHSQMIDRFMITHGGGIYIVCGGTLRLDENARLGASWSGLGEDYNGAAGYGGSGMVQLSKSTQIYLGGVGGGAGGRGGVWQNLDSSKLDANYIATPGAVTSKGSSGSSSAGGCGGGGGGCGGIGAGTNGAYAAGGSGGGCQGELGGHNGGVNNQVSSVDSVSGNRSYGCNGGHGKYASRSNSSNNVYYFGGAGGGGAGGNGGDCGYSEGGKGGIAGSCIVIVSKRASIPEASISTGGQRGTYQPTMLNEGTAAGSGGTGFCYMAVGEFLDE